MTLYTMLIQPFENVAMRQALAACVALSFSSAPLGVFLILRRMTLMGDAMSHGILSGVAVAFVLFGHALWPMMAFAVIAGLLIAGLSGTISRVTPLKEDASLAGIYLISLAIAAVVMATQGDTDMLEEALFGNIFVMPAQSLRFIAATAAFTLVALSIIYRGLVIECFDPHFLRVARARGSLYHFVFLLLVVMNLVAAFQAMGMLMALALITLPAIAAQLWSRNIDRLIPVAIMLTLLSSTAGLLVSYHYKIPSGAGIALCAGAVYILSIFLGSRGGLITRLLPHRHEVDHA